jgi:hypothetical protein
VVPEDADGRILGYNFGFGAGRVIVLEGIAACLARAQPFFAPTPLVKSA